MVLRNSTTLVMHMKVYDEASSWVRQGKEAGPSGLGVEARVRQEALSKRGIARSVLLTTHGAPLSQGPGALQDWRPSGRSW